MKYLVLIYIVLFSLSALAQSNTTELPRTFNEHKNKGVKIALLQSVFDLEFENSFYKESANIEQKYGFLLGYQHIPAYDVGFNVQAAYNMAKNEFDPTIESLRLEANIAYGINEMVHVLGGVNVQKYLGGYDNLTSDLGYQLGFGANINTFNVSLMYYYIQNSTDLFVGALDSLETKMTLSGVELAVGVTF